MKSVLLNNDGELLEAVPVDLVEPVPAPAIDATKWVGSWVNLTN